MDFTSPKWEAIKELGRLLLLAIIPVLLTTLADVQDQTLWVLIGTALLRAIDRAIHVSDSPTNGIVPF